MEKLAPRHPLPRSRTVDRDRYLLELCRGKRVLHLACAGWPATKAWADDGSLLHLRLARECRELAGFDNSRPGIEVLRERDVENLFLVDLLDAKQLEHAWSRLPFEPEVVLAGELIEHLESPGVLLRNCRRHLPDDSLMIITVPNSFSLRSFLHVLRGYEKVASDHVAYYSLANLRELTGRCGFQLDQMRWYNYSQPRRPLDRGLDLVLNPLLRLWPQLSEGLIALCHPVAAKKPSSESELASSVQSK